MSDTTNTPIFWVWFRRIFTVIGIFTVLFFIALIFLASRSSGKIEVKGNVAHLKLNGPIMSRLDQSSLFASYEAVDASKVVAKLNKLKTNFKIQAILIEIDSPGGTPVASAEIADAIKETGLPSIAWIRDVGASGAYWIASATDHIISHPLSITGSIGVVGNYFGFEELLPHLKINLRRQIAGSMKDIGSPYRQQTDEEKKYMQTVLDQMHQEFISAVQVNRKLEEGWQKEGANGLFFTGIKALQLGLVDSLGGKKEALKWLKEKIDQPVELAPMMRGSIINQIMDELQVRTGQMLSFSLESFFKRLFVSSSTPDMQL